MAEAKCESCGKEFAYDEESGLNMRDFPMESNARFIRLGGVMPACPECGEMYRPPPVYTEIKWERKWMPKRPPMLSGKKEGG